MKKYKSHKVVEAALLLGMSEQDDDMLALITADKDEAGNNIVVMAKKDIISRYQPKEGDYLVKYRDGYMAISPGKEFEDGYTPVDEEGYKKRVLNEKEDLQVKLDALMRFINSREFKQLDGHEADRLRNQSDLMLAYLNVLTERSLYFL